MAENLITDRELAVWAGTTETAIARDPLAQDVMLKMSSYARFLAFAPKPEGEWGWATRDETPFDVKLMVLKICRRAYTNPNEVVREGNIGPIGGDTLREEAALGMELTALERGTFTAYNPAGDPTEGDTGALWVQPTSGGTGQISQDATLYVSDDQQINLSTSPDPRPWKIPLFNPGDPGESDE